VIKMDDQRTHIISALVLHKPGVLQRVAGLFTRRGFNIESITVGTSEQEEIARMTIIAKGDGKVLEQITKQLNKRSCLNRESEKASIAPWNLHRRKLIR